MNYNSLLQTCLVRVVEVFLELKMAKEGPDPHRVVLFLCVWWDEGIDPVKEWLSRWRLLNRDSYCLQSLLCARRIYLSIPELGLGTRNPF